MGRRRAGRLGREFDGRSQGVVACVTRQVLVGRPGEGPIRRVLLEREATTRAIAWRVICYTDTGVNPTSARSA